MEVTNNPQFRVVHINAFFGGLSPIEGRIKFYTDILETRIKPDGKTGEMEIEKINRECQIDIRMSAIDFVALAGWMNAHIKRLEDRGILKKKDLAHDGQTDYSV
jgi:hypothetical protein